MATAYMATMPQVLPLDYFEIHSDEFEASETMCCNKSYEWLKNNSHLIWKSIPSICPFILYLLHHNFSGLYIPVNIMFPVNMFR
jgi:hypothetical protein